LAARNEGVGEGCGGTGRTQMREKTTANALSTPIAYPLG